MPILLKQNQFLTPLIHTQPASQNLKSMPGSHHIFPHLHKPLKLYRYNLIHLSNIQQPNPTSNLSICLSTPKLFQPRTVLSTKFKNSKSKSNHSRSHNCSHFHNKSNQYNYKNIQLILNLPKMTSSTTPN